MKLSDGLNLETVLTHAPGVFRAELDGTLLVAARQGGQAHCMDPIGLAIWGNLAHPCSIDNLCTILCDGYDVEKADCERDVLEFIAELLEKKLVIIVEPMP